MIRFITPADIEPLVALADSIGLFSPEQLDTLRPMMTAALNSESEQHAFWITDDDDGLVSLAYCEPERMTEGTWNLQLIAVHPANQRQGRGRQLLRHLDQTLAARGSRILLVDTVGTHDFEYVRAFYRRNGSGGGADSGFLRGRLGQNRLPSRLAPADDPCLSIVVLGHGYEAKHG